MNTRLRGAAHRQADPRREDPAGVLRGVPRAIVDASPAGTVSLPCSENRHPLPTGESCMRFLSDSSPRLLHLGK